MSKAKLLLRIPTGHNTGDDELAFDDERAIIEFLVLHLEKPVTETMLARLAQMYIWDLVKTYPTEVQELLRNTLKKKLPPDASPESPSVAKPDIMVPTAEEEVLWEETYHEWGLAPHQINWLLKRVNVAVSPTELRSMSAATLASRGMHKGMANNIVKRRDVHFEKVRNEAPTEE